MWHISQKPHHCRPRTQNKFRHVPCFLRYAPFTMYSTYNIYRRPILSRFLRCTRGAMHLKTTSRHWHERALHISKTASHGGHISQKPIYSCRRVTHLKNHNIVINVHCVSQKLMWTCAAHLKNHVTCRRYGLGKVYCRRIATYLKNCTQVKLSLTCPCVDGNMKFGFWDRPMVWEPIERPRTSSMSTKLARPVSIPSN